MVDLEVMIALVEEAVLAAVDNQDLPKDLLIMVVMVEMVLHSLSLELP